MSLEDRFDALTGVGQTEPPTIADLQRRQRRRRRRQVISSVALATVVVLAVGAVAVATRSSQESGLTTAGQPTQPTTTATSGSIPVVTAATLTAGYVPAGFRLVRSAVGGSSIAIVGVDAHGTLPPQAEGRPGGPRSLYSLVYVMGVPSGTITSPPEPTTLMADASTEADYPTGFIAGFDSSKAWQHVVTVGGRHLDLNQSSPGNWFASFAQDGVYVEVTAQHLSRAELLRFAGGLEIQVTG